MHLRQNKDWTGTSLWHVKIQTVEYERRPIIIFFGPTEKSPKLRASPVHNCQKMLDAIIEELFFRNCDPSWPDAWNQDDGGSSYEISKLIKPSVLLCSVNRKPIRLFESTTHFQKLLKSPLFLFQRNFWSAGLTDEYFRIRGLGIFLNSFTDIKRLYRLSFYLRFQFLRLQSHRSQVWRTQLNQRFMRERFGYFCFCLVLSQHSTICSNRFVTCVCGLQLLWGLILTY